ncbi:hypothetical protein OU995_15505 [Roseateles sp. SL47]|nr:hypothetical protein [Roseateles sp. SL47]WAC71013.1 hypothetical protein OU995_15505 [Roseateles sp. SL47]
MTKRQHGNKELKKPKQEKPSAELSPASIASPAATPPAAPARRPRVGRR